MADQTGQFFPLTSEKAGPYFYNMVVVHHISIGSADMQLTQEIRLKKRNEFFKEAAATTIDLKCKCC